MTLFSIQCATCQAQLNVRDPALIGQILGCPKCSSMVLVEAPEGFDPDQIADSDSAAAADSDVSTEAVDEDSGALSAPQGKRRKQTMAIQPVATKNGPAPHPHYDSSADTKPMLMPEASELAEQKPILPSADWSSSESQQMKKILLMSGLGVGAVVLAVAFCGFWLARSRAVAQSDPQKQPSTENPPSSQGGPQGNPNDNSETPGIGENVLQGAGGTGETQTGGNSEPAGQSGKSPALVTPKNQAAGAEQNPTTAATIAEGSAEKVKPEDAGNPDGTTTKGKDPFEPGAQKRKADEAKAEEDAAAITASLRKLEDLLSPGEPRDDGHTESPLTSIKKHVDLAPKPAARNVDVDVQLRRPIESIEFVDVELIKFIRFVSEMSTIPISVDPVALQARKLSASSPLTINKESTTVGELLSAVLGPHGLVATTEENHVRIELAAAGPARLDVADLLESENQQLDQLAEWVTGLVSPTSWTGNGGAASFSVEGRSLIIDAHPNIVFETKRFLDRLRVSRGLPARHDLSDELLRLEMTEQPPILAIPVTANFRIPAYFTDILTHLANESDTAILVDWKAAADAGWNQDGRVRLNVENERLDESLNSLLAPMELSFRMVEAKTIQIVTPDQSNATTEVYLHPARDVMEILNNDQQSLLTLLKATLGESRFQSTGGGIRIYFDSHSQRLLTLARPKDHRAILALLGKIRSDSKRK